SRTSSWSLKSRELDSIFCFNKDSTVRSERGSLCWGGMCLLHVEQSTCRRFCQGRVKQPKGAVNKGEARFGQTPHSYRYDRVSVIWAITVAPQRRRRGLDFALHVRNIRCTEVITFLGQLFRDLRGTVIPFSTSGGRKPCCARASTRPISRGRKLNLLLQSRLCV